MQIAVAAPLSAFHVTAQATLSSPEIRGIFAATAGENHYSWLVNTAYNQWQTDKAGTVEMLRDPSNALEILLYPDSTYIQRASIRADLDAGEYRGEAELVGNCCGVAAGGQTSVRFVIANLTGSPILLPFIVQYSFAGDDYYSSVPYPGDISSWVSLRSTLGIHLSFRSEMGNASGTKLVEVLLPARQVAEFTFETTASGDATIPEPGTAWFVAPVFAIAVLLKGKLLSRVSR
jgi:hypothetical protein